MRGIAVELIVPLVLHTLGTSIFAKFEVETPISKRLIYSAHNCSIGLMGDDICHCRFNQFVTRHLTATEPA